MRGPEYFDFPFFGRHFGPGPCSRRMGPPFGMQGCSDFQDDFRMACGPGGGYGPFGHGFNHSPDRHRPGHHHGPEHHRRGNEDRHHGPPGFGRRGPPGCNRRCSERHHDSPERDCYQISGRHCDGPSGCGRRGPGELDYHHRNRSPECGPGPHNDHGHGPRGHSPGGPPKCGSKPFNSHGYCPRDRSPGPHGHGPRDHSPGPFGPRPWLRHSSQSDHCFRPHSHNWEKPWGGPEHHKPRFEGHGPRGPCSGHRRPGPYDRPEERLQRNFDYEGHHRNECFENMENRRRDRGRKENGQCNDKNKEQNPIGDTVLVQRIVVEKAPRPQSV